jgi:hypothetical protein
MEQLRGSIAAHLTHAEEHAPGYTALLRGAGGDDEVQGVLARARERVVERLLGSLPVPPTPALRLAAWGWVGLIDQTTLQWLETRELERDALRDLLTDQFVALITTAASR